MAMKYYVIVLYIATLQDYGSPLVHTDTVIQCPVFCKCNRQKKTAMCNAEVPTKHHLTYIPRLPEYVTDFKFTGNRFPNVTKETLFNLTYNTIVTLTLQESKIKLIAPDAFVDLTYLQHLEINQCMDISPENISKTFRYMNKSLPWKLYFKNNNWRSLPQDMFTDLQGSSLQLLSFFKNDFTNIDGRVFSNLSHLKELLFTSNVHLKSISLKGIPESLTKLDLSSCDFDRIPSFCDGNKSLVPSIINLNLQDNRIRKVNKTSFACLDNLKELNLNKNSIHTLKDNVFLHLRAIEKLSVSNQHKSLKRIYKFAFNSSTLKLLNLANNQLDIKTPDIFNYTPNLQNLNLENNRIHLQDTFIRRTFIPLKRLSNLILKHTGLSIIPPGLFPYLPSLRKLDLSSNSIQGWNDNPLVFGNITWLEKFYIRDNNIKLINKTSFPPMMLQNLQLIDLSVNDFACTCDLMWFRDWIKQPKQVRLLNWYKDFKCKYPPKMNGKLLRDYNPTPESCKEPNQIIAIAVSSAVVCVTVVLAITVLYKARWHIRYWIYLLRAKSHGYSAIGGDVDYRYDGFVVYCEEDREWVHGVLIEKMEKEQGYKLCVHYRDFDVGKLVVDNIIECMEQSRKIIMVLSNAFARSDWCQFELRVSQGRLFETNTDVLVLVMLEEINAKNLTSALKTAITTTTYAAWTNDNLGQTQFWDQLCSTFAK